MHFDAFVSRCRQLWPEFTDPSRLAQSRYPSDRSLANILRQVPGMATENKLALLNAAVSALGDNEVYVGLCPDQHGKDTPRISLAPGFFNLPLSESIDLHSNPISRIANGKFRPRLCQNSLVLPVRKIRPLRSRYIQFFLIAEGSDDPRN